jgi:hypothetical protein
LTVEFVHEHQQYSQRKRRDLAFSRPSDEICLGNRTQADDSKLAVGMNADAPYDAIKVNLPTGMSIGVVSFGNVGLDSATLKTSERKNEE